MEFDGCRGHFSRIFTYDNFYISNKNISLL